MSDSGRPTPTDEQYRQALFQTFDLGDELMQASARGGLWPAVLPGSQMESDDAETDPFQMSHIIQNLINAAIEHLHSIGALVRKAGLLHNSPPFTLARSGVETAATAVWLLRPTEQRKRLWRHLVVIRQDTFDYEQVTNLMRDSLKDRYSDLGDAPNIARRRAHADRIRTRHHITGLPNKLDLVHMLKTVDDEIAKEASSTNDHTLELYWRIASGFGHGRQWSTIYALERGSVTPLGDSTALVNMSNTESRVLWGTSNTYELIDRALRLVYAACGHNVDRLDLSKPMGNAGRESES